MKEFEGKVALVTGGGGGIGAQTARMFAQNSCATIVVADIAIDKAQKVCEQIQSCSDANTFAYKLDVVSEECVHLLFDETARKFGGVDFLINCIGVCPTQGIEDTTIKGWDNTLNINLRGVFLCCREAFRQMKEKKFGRIVNTTSISARIGGIGTGMDYVASKGGVLSMTMGFAKRGAPYGINVNSVAPGFIHTAMTRDLKHFDPKSVPLGRIGEPQDVSGVFKFLCSEDARYITGACIDVNGGVFMCS